ncbi:hypothetical protein KUTeg_012636 [Tegillarca granosa]|uniref:Chitin-binding type-2 domain-containing protein n=1 Tax=Tegillarca granosa TaxID=220873 RepID=A0ABQ9F2K3_TEGGR|nr:hypothetical protein KUTeg_012636 [Tegillarca granosa]
MEETVTVTLHKHAGKLFQEEIKYDVEDENDNTTIVDIACSTQSSCTPTSIWLFSEKGGVTQRRFDINFTCIIEYNTQDGTNVECTGSVPGSLIKSFDTILCRPLLNDSKKAEDKQASVRPPVCVGDECTFSCPDEGADIFYMDPLDCTVLHRCADRRLYSGICANSTYFNPSKCTCDHKNNVQGCNEDGKRIEKLKDTRCGDSAINN